MSAFRLEEAQMVLEQNGLRYRRASELPHLLGLEGLMALGFNGQLNVIILQLFGEDNVAKVFFPSNLDSGISEGDWWYISKRDNPIPATHQEIKTGFELLKSGLSLLGLAVSKYTHYLTLVDSRRRLSHRMDLYFLYWRFSRTIFTPDFPHLMSVARSGKL